MCEGGSVEPAKRGGECVGEWRVELNHIYETADSDPAATRSSLDVPSDLDADRSMPVGELTIIPSIAVHGHLRGIGHLRGTDVVACHLAHRTLWHRERLTARTRGAHLPIAWTETRGNSELTESDNLGVRARGTRARGVVDDSVLRVGA